MRVESTADTAADVAIDSERRVQMQQTGQRGKARARTWLPDAPRPADVACPASAWASDAGSCCGALLTGLPLRSSRLIAGSDCRETPPPRGAAWLLKPGLTPWAAAGDSAADGGGSDATGCWLAPRQELSVLCLSTVVPAVGPDTLLSSGSSCLATRPRPGRGAAMRPASRLAAQPGGITSLSAEPRRLGPWLPLPLSTLLLRIKGLQSNTTAFNHAPKGGTQHNLNC